MDHSYDPGFPFCLPVRQTAYTQPLPLALPLPATGKPEICLIFMRSPRHSSGRCIFFVLMDLSACREFLLPRRQRQRLDPPHHAPKQPPRLGDSLRKHQPVITGMSHQPAARLHQPVLQTRQRPVLDSLGQHCYAGRRRYLICRQKYLNWVNHPFCQKQSAQRIHCLKKQYTNQ